MSTANFFPVPGRASRNRCAGRTPPHPPSRPPHAEHTGMYTHP